MSESNSIRFVGDVSIQDVSIVTSAGLTQNITNQVMAIELYEDLYSPFTTGIINVNDSFDFISVLPFIGEEYVNISIFTPSMEKDNSIKDQYYIYKVSNRTIVNLRTQVYQLHFISKEAIVDMNKKNSKAYAGNIGDIVKQLCTEKIDGLESTKSINVDDTSNATKFIANYWSPVKSINYLCDRAVSKSNASNYVFFENRRGLNFASLDILYQQPVYQDFTYDSYSRDYRPDGTTIINLDRDYKRISNIEIPTVYDYTQRLLAGTYGSKIISHDLTTKRFLSIDYKMEQEFTEQIHLNAFPIVSNKNIALPNAVIVNNTRSYGSYNGYTDITNFKTIQKRLSRLGQANATTVNITVPGRSDYTVGTIISLDLNKLQPIEKKDDAQDKVFSGKYIVTAINHYIDRSGHECTMECAKDSYLFDLNSR